MMIFYGVMIDDKEISLAFDLLRFLAQPDAYRKTHITVRGPYKNRLSQRKLDKFVLLDIGIEAPGHFFYSNQNTVFLKCNVPGIRDVWHKPDFKDGIPHLTIYDGDDRQFAASIHSILMNYEWNIWRRSTALRELTKKTKSGVEMNLKEHEFSLYFRNTIVSSIITGPEKVTALSKRERLDLFEKVIDFKLKKHMNPIEEFGKKVGLVNVVKRLI